jgi:transcriptional regulator with XRE-family HTH domain
MSQIERKRINLGIDSLGKIADVLGRKVCELLAEPAEEEQPPVSLRPGRLS